MLLPSAGLRWKVGQVNAADVAALRSSDDGAYGPGGVPCGEGAEPRMTRPPTALHAPGETHSCPRQAFDAAVAEHRPELLDYLGRRLRDRDTASDLAQEALARMMKYRDVGDIDDYRLMLFRIANNLILEHYRTRQRRRASDHHSLDDTEPLRSPEPTVEAIVDARQAIDMLLKRTIASLPPKCRLAFMLSRFDGQSYPQIAERMGISVKMVEKHITKALLACRAAVGDRDG